MKKQHSYSLEEMTNFLRDPMGAFRAMMSSIDAKNKKEAKDAMYEKLGIKMQDRMLGSDLLGINYKYFDIEMKNGLLYCYSDYEIRVDLYDLTGKLLLTGRDIDQIGDKWFLVEVMEEEEEDKKLCKLMSLDGFVSEHYYRGIMSSKFTKEGYCILGTEEKNDKSDRKYKSVIVDKNGKEIYLTDKFSHPYIYGNVLYDDKKYINLLTGEVILEKGYDTISSKNHIIFKSYDKKFGNDSAVVMLNIYTCETKIID